VHGQDPCDARVETNNSDDGWLDECLDVLRQAHIQLTDGLSDSEIEAIEAEFALTFSPDHRSLLAAAVPLGESWLNWHERERDKVAYALGWPADGALFDVSNNAFWPLSWGSRPDDEGAALDIASKRMAQVPTLVPLYGHRYMPAAPAPTSSPVFSVHQTDVIYYGANLLSYLRCEFLHEPWTVAVADVKVRIPFWSDLAEGAKDAYL